MQGKEFEEEVMLKEQFDANKSPLDGIKDHEMDETYFEISLVNKHNKCITIDARVKDSNVEFNRLKVLNTDGIQY